MRAQPDEHRGPEPRGSRRSSRLGRWSSLRGGAGVGIIAGSAVLGAGVTIATRAQPGQVLGGCIVVGTVAAALTVRPRAGRLIFPAPSLFYLIAALVAGIVYNRSTSKTELALGATQWIADGFFLMALATVLAVVIITARWYLGRRGGRGQPAPDRPGPADGTSRRTQRGRDEYETTGDREARGTRGAAPPLRGREDPPGGFVGSGGYAGPGGSGGSGGYAAPRPSRPQPGPRPQGSAGPDQRNGQYPGQFSGGPNYGSYPERRDGDRRPGPAYDQRPGSGPYNFSSGA
ncbi:MAG TPA: DUF6542 domain-containing protein [Streptosporangiaceae bacterium]